MSSSSAAGRAPSTAARSRRARSRPSSASPSRYSACCGSWPCWRSAYRSLEGGVAVRTHLARLVGAIAGIGFVLWLIYAELILIGAICLWCTVAHVIAFALFVVVVLTTPPLLAEG